MNTTWAQLRALIGLRWTMVRSRRMRRGLVVLAAFLLVLLTVMVVSARLAPRDRSFNAAIVMPTAFLIYAALAVIGPLAAGGGNELFPSQDLSPHPVRPATMFLASLALAPLNIAWVGQTLTLASLTAYVAGSWHGLPAALLVTFTFTTAASVCGQAIAWGVTGLRQSDWGRRVVWAAAALLAAAAAAVLHSGLTHFLDRAPTRPVVVAMLQGAHGNYGRWAVMLLLLAAVAVAGLRAGGRATGYALRRPAGPAASRQARAMRRRSPRHLRAQLRAIDRAGVWRAPALRRGVIVIGILPGAAAAAARLDWASLAMTGGLVTAGAGLLFGVNAFCIDAGGALWLTSLPLRPNEHFLSKAWVTAETCLICAAITIAAGAARADGPIGAVDALTLGCTVLACAGTVVAICMRSSVARPHRAELRGPRDTPAPPGSMALNSAKLAAATTVVAMSISGLGLTGDPLGPALLTVSVLCLCTVSLRRTAHMYRDGTIRSRVAITVAVG